jgi:predicted nucleic acid-binding protein
VSSNASTPGSGSRVALDTSIAIDVLANQADDLLSPDIDQHLLPVPVVGELRYGALNSRKATENLAKVEGLVARCQILNVTATTAEVTRGCASTSSRRVSLFRRTTFGLGPSASSTKCR